MDTTSGTNNGNTAKSGISNITNFIPRKSAGSGSGTSGRSGRNTTDNGTRRNDTGRNSSRNSRRNATEQEVQPTTEDTVSEQNIQVEDSISLSFDESSVPPEPKRRGRKPGSTTKKKLTAAAAVAAGKRVAHKVCDLASLGAVLVIKTPLAAITKDERDAIVEPAANLLARYEWVEQLDSVSDGVSLVVAVGAYGFRLYTLYAMSKNPEMVEQVNAFMQMMQGNMQPTPSPEPSLNGVDEHFIPVDDAASFVG